MPRRLLSLAAACVAALLALSVASATAHTSTHHHRASCPRAHAPRSCRHRTHTTKAVSGAAQGAGVLMLPGNSLPAVAARVPLDVPCPNQNLVPNADNLTAV